MFASWTGAMINPQWLELPMSRMNFHGPKDVRAIEVRLYIYIDIKEIWFEIANGQISSIFYGVICPRHAHILVSRW